MTSSDPPKHNRSGISALVLAAGMSRRMGRSKQLLRLGDSTLLERSLASVRKANVDEIILVLGCDAEEIQRSVSTSGLVVVLNEQYQQGMGTSLRRGLSAMNAEAHGAFVILADQPFVSPTTLNQMVDHHHHHKPQVTIPTYKGFRGNPILLDRSVFPELADLRGDVGCRAIFGNHTGNIHKFAVEDPGILLDVDTLDDLDKLQELLHEGGAGSLAKADLEEAESVERNVLRPEVVIVGRDPLAMALARIARILEFTVTVVDPFLALAEAPEANRILHRLDFNLLPLNDDRYFVIASRGQFDEEALEKALVTNAGYVGLMAGKGRREELIRIMKTKELREESLTRLRAPAGLEIGAETPQEIALSIMAEIVAERKKGGSF